MITTTAVAFAVNILTSILKKYIYPKYGKIGVHVLVFSLAIIAAVYGSFVSHWHGLQEIVEKALGVYVLAVAIYEGLLQYIPTFKGVAVTGDWDITK